MKHYKCIFLALCRLFNTFVLWTITIEINVIKQFFVLYKLSNSYNYVELSDINSLTLLFLNYQFDIACSKNFKQFFFCLVYIVYINSLQIHLRIMWLISAYMLLRSQGQGSTHNLENVQTFTVILFANNNIRFILNLIKSFQVRNLNTMWSFECFFALYFRVLWSFQCFFALDFHGSDCLSFPGIERSTCM